MEEIESYLGSIITHRKDGDGKMSIRMLLSLFDEKFPKGKWNRVCKKACGTLGNFIKSNDNFCFSRVSAGKHRCGLEDGAKFKLIEKEKIFPEKKKRNLSNVVINKEDGIKDFRQVRFPLKHRGDLGMGFVKKKFNMNDHLGKEININVNDQSGLSQREIAELVKRKVRALYNFSTKVEEEIPFRKGDILSVYKDQGEWFYCGLKQMYGFVPSNYVEDI